MTQKRSHSRRSRALTAVLFTSLVAVPILEVWLLIKVGRSVGVLPTLGVLVVGAALGAWLMRREGRRAYAALTGAFTTGRMPARELADAALVLVGGVLLMLPGFATDAFGLVCLLPFTRPLARRLLTRLVGRRLNELGATSRRPVPRMPATGFGQNFADDEVISGETVDGPPAHPTQPSGAHLAELDRDRR